MMFGRTLELIARARARDAEALAELTQRYSAELGTRLRALVGHELRASTDLEDFLQEMWLDVLKSIDQSSLVDEEAFLRWATHIACNNVRDAARRRRLRAMETLATSFCSHGPADRSVDRPDRQAQREEDVLRLDRALATLSEEYRMVVELRDLSGLPYREIAERLGRSEAAVQMLHARALARLSEELSDPGDR